jgi:hypothetical protein
LQYNNIKLLEVLDIVVGVCFEIGKPIYVPYKYVKTLVASILGLGRCTSSGRGGLRYFDGCRSLLDFEEVLSPPESGPTRLLEL